MRTMKKTVARRRSSLHLESLERRELLNGNPVWSSYAGNPQHTALSTVASQSLDTIRWQTPVDLNPQYSGNDLLIHYGSPIVTAANTVIVPVKTGASGGFQIVGRRGSDGSVLWAQTSDYVLPPHNWVPSYSPALTPNNRVYFPGIGGSIYYIDNPDTPGATLSGQIFFYGSSNYSSALEDGSVFINTPVTTDSAGDVYFGFQVTPAAGIRLPDGNSFKSRKAVLRLQLRRFRFQGRFGLMTFSGSRPCAR